MRMRRLPQQQLRWTSACSLALPPDRRTSMTGARNRGRRRDVSICGAGGAGSANGGLAAMERGARFWSVGDGPGGAARRGGEGGREPGRDKAGARATVGLLREVTRNDVSDGNGCRRRRDCVFGRIYVIGSHERPWEMNQLVFRLLCVCVGDFVARQTHVTWWQRVHILLNA
ncbi:hypothetical protein H4582DRAFT_2129440 [Lactarius indigo]|nr:hypothetical protein H4582DRAFT_2129440 [Lactarius indigo]